jgi:triacylglycerol lipase
MVSVASAKWGEHVKTYSLSHLEQMDMRVKDERESLYRTFWLDIVKMLEKKGH